MAQLAIYTYFIGLFILLRRDQAKDRQVSGALWIPLIWMLILASRLPSQWVGYYTASSAQAAYEDGNPLDRLIYTVLIVLALRTLVSRSVKWDKVIGENFPLAALLGFALLSVAWSDFPFISIRHWIRDSGSYLVMLVALTEDNPAQAIEMLIRRLGYFLIPLSVVLIKYYPQFGTDYSFWTGAKYYVGVTTNKNLLGVLCLISGLYFFWEFMGHWSGRKERRAREIMVIDIAFFGMTLWLLNLANSSTSSLCLFTGCLLIAGSRTKFIQQNPSRLKTIIPVVLFLLVFFDQIGLREAVTHMVDRNTTFTGRTELWEYLDKSGAYTLLGAGYESFWLGPRLDKIWALFAVLPNEAHNGYLEVWLNLGLVGLLILFAYLLTAYFKICSRLRTSPSSAIFGLTFWIILLFYNITEAAFKNGHILWLTFLMVNTHLSTAQEERRYYFRRAKDSSETYSHGSDAVTVTAPIITITAANLES